MLHVEVRFSDADEASYLSVVLWCAEDEPGPAGAAAAALSLQNQSEAALTVLQEGPDWSTLPPERFELTVRPGGWRSLGWVDPSLGSVLRSVLCLCAVTGQ